MRALRFYGHHDVRIEDIPEPTCTAGTVKVKPAFNGLCGSDLHAYFDATFAHVGFTHPLTREAPPIVFGHELSGTVTETGPDITHLQIGDKVAVFPVHSDGTCDACLQDAPNNCATLGFMGLHGGGGGLSDAVVVKESSAYKLPDGLDLELGALVEPLAVGWHGVSATRGWTPESTVLVLGGGPVGCAVVLALFAKGVTRVLVSEPSEARARIVREIGVATVWNPLEKSVEEEVMKFTARRGADAVYECSGVPAAFETACNVVRVRGQIVNLSIWSSERPFNLSGSLMRKEASILPVMAYTHADFRAVVDALASGKMDNAKAMITKRIALDKLVEEGLEPLHHPGMGHCKILVDLSL